MYVYISFMKLTPKESEALIKIRNFSLQHGHTPSVRDLMKEMSHASPRSSAFLIDRLVEKGFLAKKEAGNIKILNNAQSNKDDSKTVAVPLIGSVSCGTPILAEENVEAMISVSTALINPGAKYFLLKANGDSMNEAGINSGDLLLIRQQFTANNGDRVVALIDDEATVKEFHKTSEAVVLKPKSTNKKHKPIILTNNFQIQGIVKKVIPNFGL